MPEDFSALTERDLNHLRQQVSLGREQLRLGTIRTTALKTLGGGSKASIPTSKILVMS
jgi:hypothetical protein